MLSLSNLLKTSYSISHVNVMPRYFDFDSGHSRLVDPGHKPHKGKDDLTCSMKGLRFRNFDRIYWSD